METSVPRVGAVAGTPLGSVGGPPWTRTTYLRVTNVWSVCSK